MNPYEIAVKLTMQNGISPVLAILGKEVLGLEGGIARLTRAFSTLNSTSLMVAGSLGIVGGVGLLGALKHVADHGDKLLDQQDKLQRAGVSYNEVLRLQADYYSKIAKSVPTSTVSEYLKQINELRSVVGSDKAAQIAPWSMKLEAVIANATGKRADGEGFKMWRAMEMTGRTISDPEGTSKLADALAQNIIGSGGKLDAGIYQTMAKRAGVAWANAKPEFLTGPMSVVAADLGGDTAGTALMSAYMFMSGANTLSKQQGQLLLKSGLLREGFYEEDKGGRINVKPGGILGSTEYGGKGKFDLYGWVQNILSPHLKAHALAGEEGNVADLIQTIGQGKISRMEMTAEQRTAFDSYIAKAGRNRNVMRMFTMFSDPEFNEQIEKDISQWKGSSGVDKAYNDAMQRNPKFVKEAFGKQYESMMESIGAPLMQAAIPVMKQVTEFFSKFGAWANAHPDTIAQYGKALAALGVGLVALGGAAVIAGLMALVGGGGLLFAFTAGIGALCALHWDAVLPWLELFGKGMSTLAGIGWDALVAGIKGIGSALEWLKEKISGFFSGLFSKTSYDGGGFGSGGLLHRVSLGNSSGGGSGGGWSASYGGGSTPVGTGTGSDVKRVVDAAAMANGVNPRVLYGIIAGESGHGNNYDFNGKGESSWSMFQLNRAGGLGNTFERETGLNVKDPSNIPAIANWVAKYIAKTHNLHPWHGFHGARDWNPKWGSMGYSPKKTSTGEKHEFHIHLDGKEITASVTRHIVTATTHPTTGPYHDGSRAWSPPDTSLVGV